MIAIIFSKDRAMQLRLCLESLYDNINEKIEISVLYKYSSEDHKKSYEKLKNIYADVNFIEEKNFKNQLIELISNKMYVLFLVDDNIFTNKFNVGEIKKILDSNKNMVGFSLRLGKNTTFCYPIQQEQKVPEMINIDDEKLKFIWVIAEKDFSYPLDISSSIYKVDKIKCLINNLDYSNPNQLEWIMYINLPFARFNYPFLGCYEKSVSFCNPINRVQEFNENRASMKYTSEFLLEKFNENYKIDYTPFKNFISNSCHQEVDISLVVEENEPSN